MKKYIIVALCLVAVWGCSDDKGSNPVDDRLPFIEGMVYRVENGETRDTMGNENKVGTLCQNGDKYDLEAYPNLTEQVIAINIFADEEHEASIYLEKARVSQELLDEIPIKYRNRVPQHDTYSEFKVLDIILKEGTNSVLITVQDMTPGPYLLKVISESGEERCTPILVATPQKSENP